VPVSLDLGVCDSFLTIAKHQKLLSLACSDLAKQWEKVEWYAQRILAHYSAGVGACWVEVSQQRSIPLLIWLALLLQVIPLSIDVISDDRFDHAFSVSVWIGGANWAILRNGYHVGNSGRIAVDGRGRGEDNVGDIVLGHAAEESDGSANIDAVVFEGDLGGFTNGL
jgi:hypothetical protein